MQEEKFYNYSSNLGRIFTSAKSLLGLSLLRYKFLVDSSEKSFDCTYAKLTLSNYLDNSDTEISQLKQMRDSLTTLIEELEHEKRNCT